MRIFPTLTVVLIPLLLSGCIASKIITAPFKAAGTVVETAVDATTQTQSEKEEDIGRRVLDKRQACLDQADNKQERKACKAQYNGD